LIIESYNTGTPKALGHGTTISMANGRLSIIEGPKSPSLVSITFAEAFDSSWSQHADNVAVIAHEQGVQHTYRELGERSVRLAASLYHLGVRSGDRVAVNLSNRVEYAEVCRSSLLSFRGSLSLTFRQIFLACSRIGAYCTLLNYAYSSAELLAALRLTTPRVLFTALTTSRFDYREALQAVTRQDHGIERIVVLPHATATSDVRDFSCNLTCHVFADLMCEPPVSRHDASKQTQPQDTLILQFTSGSTAAPKAAALTHSGVVNSARYLTQNMRVTAHDSLLIPVPLFHAFGFIMGLCVALLAGATVVLPSEYFDAALAMEATRKYTCTGIYGVTTMFVDFLAHVSSKEPRSSSLR
jgi:mevalonyl-CoA ligase